MGLHKSGGAVLSTYPKKPQIRRLRSTLDFRACLGQSIFIQTAFMVQLLGCSRRPKKKKKKREALWEQMERRSNSNEPSFPASNERHTGTRPEAKPASGHFLFAVVMTTG